MLEGRCFALTEEVHISFENIFDVDTFSHELVTLESQVTDLGSDDSIFNAFEFFFIFLNTSAQENDGPSDGEVCASVEPLCTIAFDMKELSELSFGFEFKPFARYLEFFGELLDFLDVGPGSFGFVILGNGINRLRQCFVFVLVCFDCF